MRGRKFVICICLALIPIGLGGCGSVMESRGFGRTATIEIDPADQRLSYQTDGDPAAMRWLLRNEVKQGMTLSDVNQVLGEDGIRQYDAGWIKNNGSYRVDDEAYKWGPDSEGSSVYLVFRNGHLTNYEPSQFE